MAKQIIPVSLEANTEWQDVFKNNALGRFVRPVKNAHLNNLNSTTQIVYAFSLESQITTEVWHYVIYSNGRLTCFDEEFTTLYTVFIGSESSNGFPAESIGSFTHAVSQNQFIINSEYLSSPIYGLVGGYVATAQKVPSINPDTTALDLLPGGVATFGDRIVYSYYNQIFISDPGGAVRTIVSQNTIAFEGKVLDMFQAGPQGNFYVFTTESIYVLPSDGIAGQQSYSGYISRLKGYEATQLRNAAYSRGKVFGIIGNGIWDVNAETKIELINYRRSRKLTSSVGNFQDLRFGRIYPTDNGFIININGSACLIDIVNQYSTWITSATAADIVGVLKTRDGTSIYASTNGIWEFIGNFNILQSSATLGLSCDFDYTPPVGGTDVGNVSGKCATIIDTPPELSPVIRDIVASADNHGRAISTYLRNSLQTTTTGGALGYLNNNAVPGAIVNTSVWDNSIYFEKKMRSTRHARAVRGDSLDMELKVNGSLAKISTDIKIYINGQGIDRPNI